MLSARVQSDVGVSLQLASKQLVGMLLIIIVKSAIKDRFTHVQATSIGAGILGLMARLRVVCMYPLD